MDITGPFLAYRQAVEFRVRLHTLLGSLKGDHGLEDLPQCWGGGGGEVWGSGFRRSLKSCLKTAGRKPEMPGPKLRIRSGI